MSIHDYGSGYSSGRSSGLQEGRNAGYSSGESAGYNRGYSRGKRAGYNKGWNEGQNAGYNQGWNARQSEIDKNIVDSNHGIAFFEWKVRTLMEMLHVAAPMVDSHLSAEDQERFTFALSITPREKDNSGTGSSYQAFLQAPEYRSYYEQHQPYFERIKKEKTAAERAKAKAIKRKKLRRVVRIVVVLGVIAFLVKLFFL